LLLLYRFVEPKDKFYTSGVLFFVFDLGISSKLISFLEWISSGGPRYHRHECYVKTL